MYRQKVVTLVAGLLFCAGAMAEDCERFKLHGVHLGDTNREIRAMHGKPYRYHNYLLRTREYYKFESTELIVTYSEGRKKKAIDLELRVPDVTYHKVRDAMIENFGSPSWNNVDPEPEIDQDVMTWESDECDVYVTVFHSQTQSHAFSGDSLIVQMRELTFKGADPFK